MKIEYDTTDGKISIGIWQFYKDFIASNQGLKRDLIRCAWLDEENINAIADIAGCGFAYNGDSPSDTSIDKLRKALMNNEPEIVRKAFSDILSDNKKLKGQLNNIEEWAWKLYHHLNRTDRFEDPCPQLPQKHMTTGGEFWAWFNESVKEADKIVSELQVD